MLSLGSGRARLAGFLLVPGGRDVVAEVRGEARLGGQGVLGQHRPGLISGAVLLERLDGDPLIGQCLFVPAEIAQDAGPVHVAVGEARIERDRPRGGL
jgi:hypothetical protein